MNTTPPDEPIVSLRRLFKWAIWGGIVWLLLSWIIVPLGMNEWAGLAKHGRVVDEQGNPLPGVTIVTKLGSIGGFHGAFINCAARYVTQTDVNGEYNVPSYFQVVTRIGGLNWGLAPYKSGWLRKGEDNPLPPRPYTTEFPTYHWEGDAPPHPLTLEWMNGGLVHHVPDLAMKPSNLPPDERVDYLHSLQESMGCNDFGLAEISGQVFREAWAGVCEKVPQKDWTIDSAHNLWMLVKMVKTDISLSVQSAKLEEIFNSFIKKHDVVLSDDESRRVCDYLKPE